MVPSYSRVNEVMSGRRQPALLETHHTAPKKWVRLLKKGVTDEELDDMPALVMHEAYHREGSLYSENSFHNLQAKALPKIPATYEKADILDGLKSVYDDFGAPDVWTVARAWLKVRLGV